MCVDIAEKRIISVGKLYLGVAVLAVICGFSNIFFLHTLASVISEIFIKIFKCISLPIITLSIIVTLSQYGADPSMKGLWRKTLFYTLGTTLLAAGVSCMLYLLIKPSNMATVATSIIPQPNSGSYLDYLMDLIPSNIFSPFLEHQVMGALLLSMIVGFSIRYIPDLESRTAVTNFFKGIHGVFLVLTGWIVKIIPLALFGFITTTIVQLKNGVDISGLGGYLSVVILANCIQGFVVIPLILYSKKIKPFATMHAMMPALSMAFFSKSSTGTLPLTMATAENKLGMNPKISRFVLPLCTSINMNGCAAFIFTTVIYLMQNNGMEISLATMLLWILVSTIAAIGNAGVPMGCFFLSTSLLTSMNVPIVLLGLILPFYSIIDMIETALNVWSDSAVAKIIDHSNTQDS
jgi:Na+/H+-dicarboxylate symporter